MRAEDPATFDAIWGQLEVGKQPCWLRHLDDAPELVTTVVDWVRTPTWEASETMASEHADVLVGDEAEAALEHPLDDNPAASELLTHLAILRSARAIGVERTYGELHEELRHDRLTEALRIWITSLSWDESRNLLGEHADELLTDEAEQLLTEITDANEATPELLAQLGLLGLCRTRGTDAAYALLAGADAHEDPPPDDQLQATAQGKDVLALARLRAGLVPDDDGAQLRHAIAALDAGLAVEARRAITALADRTPSWERRAYARTLAELAQAGSEPSPALTELQEILLDPRPESRSAGRSSARPRPHRRRRGRSSPGNTHNTVRKPPSGRIAA